MATDRRRESWFADILADARVAAAGSNLPVSVILAQWSVETGYGSSRAWRSGNNYAGVSPGGRVASYPDRSTGLADWLRAINLRYYDTVRGITDPAAAAVALAQSPWAAGHYNADDNNPAGLLGEVMAKYDLTRFDADPITATERRRAAELLAARTNGTGNVSTLVPVPNIPLGPIGNPGGIIDAGAGLVDGILGGIRADIAKVVLAGLFVAGGVTLVVLGGWRTVSPTIRSATDRASSLMGAAA